MKIAFIGLGNMGAPMARNLIRAGHQLHLFDLNQQVLAELAEMGSRISESPKHAAQGADLVITMLPAAAHVRAVYLNEDGVLAGISPGVPAVDCSTIDPRTIRDVAAAAATYQALPAYHYAFAGKRQCRLYKAARPKLAG